MWPRPRGAEGWVGGPVSRTSPNIVVPSYDSCPGATAESALPEGAGTAVTGSPAGRPVDLPTGDVPGKQPASCVGVHREDARHVGCCPRHTQHPTEQGHSRRWRAPCCPE